MRRKHRRRLFEPESILGVLARSGEDRFAPMRDPVHPRVWRDAVGARIADRARPVSLERGVLTVRAATAVWASELSMLQDTLIARLRAARVEVRELRFRVGPVEPLSATPERRAARKVPPPAPLDTAIATALTAVEDDELRATIAAAAQANLAWQAHVARAQPGAPGVEISAGQRAARAPRDAERESDPPARTSRAAPGATRRNRADD